MTDAERFEELKNQHAWLKPELKEEYNRLKIQLGTAPLHDPMVEAPAKPETVEVPKDQLTRSEERRVGKECRL